MGMKIKITEVTEIFFVKKDSAGVSTTRKIAGKITEQLVDSSTGEILKESKCYE
jgi:hypothetical protein